jgi:hypothetical protein
MTPRPGPPLAEFTLKAVVTGIVLGIVFGAANAYLGLRVGMTVSASIPAAVMTVAVFQALRLRGTILEANLSQTVASASTSLATGTIFTIPALFLWGMAPPYWQVVVLAFLGALLGLSAMIPLRRLLIVKRARRTALPGGHGLRRGAARDGRGPGEGQRQRVDLPRHRGRRRGQGSRSRCCTCCRASSRMALPVLPKAELALEIAPALIAVGYILGYRQSAVCVAGALISAVVIIPLIAWLGASLSAPLYPETQRLVAEMDAGDDLVEVRALHRRGRGRDRRHPDGAARPAGDVLGVHRRRARRAHMRSGHAERARRPVTGPRRRAPDGSRPARRLRVRRRRDSSCSSRARARRVRRRDERRAARGARLRRRRVRRAVRRRRGAHRRARRRLVAADLRHRARDAARHGLDLRRERLDDARRARGRADGRHDRRDRRQQGGRHLAGPEDRLAGRRDARAPADRPGDRRGVRLLGGGCDRAAARSRLRVRVGPRSRRRRRC